MKKVNLYLETSVWSYYYADDAEAQLKDTQLLFGRIDEHKYNIFISLAVIREINKTKGDKKIKLQELIHKYKPNVLEETVDIYKLANKYIKTSALSPNSYDDSLHVAMTTIYNLDILVSWNYRHLTNNNSKNKINLTNIRSGYRPILILNPLEVVKYEKNQ